MTDRELLALINASPNGITQAMLLARGATRRQLDKIVASGKADVRNVAMAQPDGMVVPWFFPAEDGAPFG